jgi:transcriptional regulator with XRE-family HTH domain
MLSVYGDREAVAQLTSRLRAQRLRRNWTQAHVAKLAGLSLPTYLRLEKGDGAMSLNSVAKVLGVLGFAERLGEVVPEVEIVSLRQTLKPARQRAHVPRKHKNRTDAKRSS